MLASMRKAGVADVEETKDAQATVARAMRAKRHEAHRSEATKWSGDLREESLSDLAQLHYTLHIHNEGASMAKSKTFRLSDQSAGALEAMVAAGYAPNQTNLVEGLIRKELLRFEMAQEEVRLEAEWAEAMADPDFLSDHALIAEEFEVSDSENWKFR
jgi:hypothetical protein